MLQIFNKNIDTREKIQRVTTRESSIWSSNSMRMANNLKNWLSEKRIKTKEESITRDKWHDEARRVFFQEH